MSPTNLPADSVASDFDAAATALESILTGGARRDIVGRAAKAGSFDGALRRLRDGVRSHRFRWDAGRIELDGIVGRLDARNRRDGFHVLQDWDGKADRLNPETIPVDVLDFLAGRDIAADARSSTLAILLDYYFFYLLALLSLRIWDEGDADENLDRLHRLLTRLQGTDGSGQRFVENAETLVPIATAHFEADVSAYDRLLARVRNLNESHRVSLSLANAAILGSHLRFGFQATYARDVVAMRNDNVPDYPWLAFALSNLLSAYCRLREETDEGRERERERIVEGLLNGLSPDPRAFIGEPPSSLTGKEVAAERSRFVEQFTEHRSALLEEFERHRPSEGDYFPLAFFFNFPHNVLKGMVVDALLRGEPSGLALNDLLSGVPHGTPLSQKRRTLVDTLMGYARSSPDWIRGRWVPAIIYDQRAGRRLFVEARKRL